MISVYWLLAFIFFIVVEAATAGLTTIWFAGGALVALLLSLLHTSLWTQLAVFVIVSLVLLIFTRPIALKIIGNKTEATNVNSLIGTEAVVTEEINNLTGFGHVSVKGEPWMARSEDPSEIIPAGSVVKIKKIEGVKVIVTKEDKNV